MSGNVIIFTISAVAKVTGGLTTLVMEATEYY
jgi:hypothetical protein